MLRKFIGSPHETGNFLSQKADLLRKGHILLRQDGKLFFRGELRLHQPSVHKLLVVGLGFAHGVIGHTLHLLVAFDGDADLSGAVQVLDVDAALPVGKGVEGLRHRLHKKKYPHQFN